MFLHLVFLALQLHLAFAADSPLEVFQVEAPLRATYEGASCQQVVVQHEFAASYGTPYVGTYSPPKDCEFTTTIFNISVTSSGINYDRLGLLYFGDIEVWRMTTAMPVRTGIFWNYQKDVTVFDPLLRSEQTVIMGLDNIYNSVFTGTYNVTITALYFNDGEALTPAEMILPISTESSRDNKISVISLPDGDGATSIVFPRNTERAVVSILASGNGAEEFWYRNVLSEHINTFSNTNLSGYSPFREVQLLIDGELAGASWPFPIVFTGGISPGLWVPIVGIKTYDLPSFEIDISPWLGVLCDGTEHKLEIKVMGYDSETTLGTVGSNWWVSGSVFVWIDHQGNQTTGTPITSNLPPPDFHSSSQITPDLGLNASLWSELTGTRSLSHTSSITTSTGTRQLTFSQDLSYGNLQNYSASSFNKTVWSQSKGTTSFTSFLNDTLIENSFAYPISFTADLINPEDFQTTNSTLVAWLERSAQSTTVPILSYLTNQASAQVPWVVTTRQKGKGTYFWNNTYYEFAGAIDPAIGTNGTTEQWYSSKGFLGEYGRHVQAVDGYEPVLIVDSEHDHVIQMT
ncbi:hypothetical protein HYFRA_00009192 [Hymenoscyphus fraxineus]|uniref:Peptide N-acetyl-beta-D-glucosaminyl asparaginase amidase A N-terminal domain-containing protein n=1 Tax=Hymenoscyphus fraxineus TaxID=746836 RepID=A0A9N9KWV5_9HELO|nr:hypothetical protein HYFRA_00009192 [Hymenoscyphus fraxineus]